MKNYFKFFALRHVLEKPSRSVLTTLGVGFGIALYVAIAIINQGTRDAFRENIESISGKAKLTLSIPHASFEEEKLEEVKAIQGVAAAVPMMEIKAYFSGAKTSKEGLYILGVDLLQEQSVRVYKATDQKIIDDPLIFLNQPDSIILTKAFASKNHLTLESKIVLATTHEKKTFTVRGLLEPEGPAKAYGGALALMDIDGARFSFGKQGKIDRIDIVPESGENIEILKDRIQKKLGPSFNVERPEMASERMEKLVESYQKMLTFFSSLALLVGLFMVMNSVSISVTERKREIGILRALGALRRNILTLFMFESFFVGLLGSLLGLGLGQILSHFLVEKITLTLSSQYKTHIDVSSLSLSPTLIFSTILLGCGSALMASLVPAFKASRVSPLEAMKSKTLDLTGNNKESSVLVLTGLCLLVVCYISTRFQWNQTFRIFETLNQGTSILGSALFGPFFVYLFLTLLNYLKIGHQKPTFRLAQDNLLKSRKRTSSNIMALMVGLFLVMMIATVRSSFQYTLMNWIRQVLTADIIVTSSGRMITAEVQPVDEKIQDEILATPGVRQVGPGHGMRSRIVQIQAEKTQYTLKALDEPAEFTDYKSIPLSTDHHVERAKNLYSQNDPVIFVSENFFVKNPKLHIGDKLPIDTPKGITEFRIIDRVTDFASSNGTIYMNRAFYKKFWDDSLVTAFSVYVEPGHSVESVREAIGNRLSEKDGLVTVSNAEMRQQMTETIDQNFAYTNAIELAALLVALLGLLNTLLIAVMERTREIGVLRAVGMTRSQIMRMILSESIIQGSLGAVVAVFFGGLMGKLWIQYSLAQMMGWMIDFYLPIPSILTTIGVGALVAGLAGIIPARRAASIQITDALDYE